MPTTAPRTTSSATSVTTLLFLLVFVVAFFPDQFTALTLAPFRLLRRTPTPATPNNLPVCAPACTHIPPSDPKFPPPNPSTMSWAQRTIALPPKSRGSYLITSHIEQHVPEISQYRIGLLHLFMQHTSAALSLNENYDRDVREDMSDALDRLAPEDVDGKLYRHAAEGLDDMPAHIKSALVGVSVSVPIQEGKLAMGTWQGIWYLEFRESRHSRKVVATIQGEKM